MHSIFDQFRITECLNHSEVYNTERAKKKFKFPSYKKCTKYDNHRMEIEKNVLN